MSAILRPIFVNIHLDYSVRISVVFEQLVSAILGLFWLKFNWTAVSEFLIV